MTDNDIDMEVGNAVKEYSSNKARIACLQRKLEKFMDSLQAFLNNTSNNHLCSELKDHSSDPRKDAEELHRWLEKQEKLRKFFKDQNLDIG